MTERVDELKTAGFFFLPLQLYPWLPGQYWCQYSCGARAIDASARPEAQASSIPRPTRLQLLTSLSIPISTGYNSSSFFVCGYPRHFPGCRSRARTIRLHNILIPINPPDKMEQPHTQLLAYMQDPLSLLVHQDSAMPKKPQTSATNLPTAQHSHTRRRTRYAILPALEIHRLTLGIARAIRPS